MVHTAVCTTAMRRLFSRTQTERMHNNGEMIQGLISPCKPLRAERSTVCLLAIFWAYERTWIHKKLQLTAFNSSIIQIKTKKCKVILSQITILFQMCCFCSSTSVAQHGVTLVPHGTASQHQPFNDAFNATIFHLLPGEVS